VLAEVSFAEGWGLCVGSETLLNEDFKLCHRTPALLRAFDALVLSRRKSALRCTTNGAGTLSLDQRLAHAWLQVRPLRLAAVQGHAQAANH
jgi:hypothetical protein